MKKKPAKCPKCGKQVKTGNFCPDCGEPLSKKQQVQTKPPNTSPVLPVALFSKVALSVIFLALLVTGYLVLTENFQTQTTLTGELRFPSNACGNEFTYSIDLKDQTGEGLANQYVHIYVNGELFEKILTDQNGRISYAKEVPEEWCGRKIDFTLGYNGDLFHGSALNNFSATVFAPTRIDVSVPQTAVANEPILLTATLRNSFNQSRLSNKAILVSNGLHTNIVTDSTGIATIQLLFNETGKKTLKLRFTGDSIHSSSETPSFEINIIPQTCSDGTVVGSCSAKSAGYYCEPDKTLVFNCMFCGCPSNLVCYEGECITPEQQKTLLVSKLQESIVFVEHSDTTGSGVVLEHEDGKTVILTNKHVIEDARGVGQVKVTTSDQKQASAISIKVAPNDMDFAVIYLNGIYGAVAQVDYSKNYQIGQAVLVLGSPKGIQGSVSEGIISNMVKWKTDSNYEYSTIQTDAAVNPGNSGGGMFLQSSGDLIGINTFVLTETEGINFAIQIKELQRLKDYAIWSDFTPLLRCYDGTPYGQCSVNTIGSYCSNGLLQQICSICGCPSNYPYCITVGAMAGQCFNCGAGYEPYDDGNCCRTGWDYYGEGICCPPGYTPYEDGTCCAPGYYAVDQGICCPDGTYYANGLCYY